MSDGLVKRLREGDNFEKVMSAEKAANRIEALEAENARLREALGKALERLGASAFTNSEHAQAAEILRAALQGMTNYRTKPVVVEAKKVPPAPRAEPIPQGLVDIAVWCEGVVLTNTSSGEYCIDLLGGRKRALPGEWIVKEANGEFNVRISEFFEASYERADQ